MVQCSVPKVLEYARRAVTVRRMALVLKIVSKVVQCVCHGPMLRTHVPMVLEYARRAVTVRRAENRVQCSSNVVGLQCGQWCRTVRPVLDGVGRFSSMRDGL